MYDWKTKNTFNVQRILIFPLKQYDPPSTFFGILYLVFNSLYHSWAWLYQTQGLVTFKLTDSWWSTGEDDSSFRPCSSSGSRVRAREQGAPSRSPPRRGPGRHRWPSRHVCVAQLVSQNSGCTASILSHSRRLGYEADALHAGDPLDPPVTSWELARCFSHFSW